MNNAFSRSMALLAMGAGFTSCSDAESENLRPNILFIMTDDHTQQALYAYGKGLLDTVLYPNMNRLAEEGAIFRQSFVTNSICAPSRAVLLTGKYSHINGQIDNRNLAEFNWDQQMFPKVLQDGGYQTALIGKIHLGGTPQGFDYSKTLPGQGSYYNPVFIKEGERLQYEGHSTELITQFVVDWLDGEWDRSKPFAMLYHTKAPHRNWMPEPKYLDFLEDHVFDFPDNFFDDYEGRGSAAREQEMEIVNHMYWGHDMKFENNPYTGELDERFINQLGRMTDEQLADWRSVYNPINDAFLGGIQEEDYEIIFQPHPREISLDFLQNSSRGLHVAKFMYHRYLRDYLKTVKAVDDGIGKVLEYLEDNDLLDNTVIVYTSDQGFYLGEHGWYDKRFMYEESFSTPLLVRYPREVQAGSEVLDMVLNLDLAPTILDYAGISKPDDMQGESWRELATGREVSWRDAIYYHYYEYPAVHMVKRHYGIRTDRYKLIHFYYDVDEWEMYDLENDPREMQSVYGDPAFSEIQEQLHKKLEELRVKYGDSDELNQQFINAYLE